MAADKSVMLDYMHGSVPRKPLLLFEKRGDGMETGGSHQGPHSLPPLRPMPCAQGPPLNPRAPNPGLQGTYAMPRGPHPGLHPVPLGPGNVGSLTTPREQGPGYLGPPSGSRGPTLGFQGRLSAPWVPPPGYPGSTSSPSSSARPELLSGQTVQGFEGRGEFSVPRELMPGVQAGLSILQGLSLDYKKLLPLLRAPTAYQDPVSVPKSHTEPNSLTKGYMEPNSLSKGYMEPNSLSRQYQEPLSLPMAPVGHQDPKSFPRSYQESPSLPIGLTGHQESSLSSSHTPGYQGSFAVAQGTLSASQRLGYRGSEEQGQHLLYRGSAQQAPYSKQATTDSSVSAGANAGHPPAQRGPLIPEQGQLFSRLAHTREYPSTQQAPLLTHPEHPISTHHAQFSTTVHDRQLSAQEGYSASLGPTAKRDSPSAHYRPSVTFSASQPRFHGSQDPDLTASHSVPREPLPSFHSSSPAYPEPHSSLFTSKPTAVDQGSASACSALETYPSTYRGLPPAHSVLRAARSEDLALTSAHEGSSSLRTYDMRSGAHFAGPLQIHRNAADLEKRVEQPVWNFRRHFRSQSPPSLNASPEGRSRRSRSCSPYLTQTGDRSPQRLVRRSRSPNSISGRYRSPQKLPRRSRSPLAHVPPYHSPRQLSRRSRSPLSPPRYRSTRPPSTRNSSRSPHSSVPGYRSPPRRSRGSRSRSPHSRRPRHRSPQRGPRRSPLPSSSPRRTRSPQKEVGRNRSRSPRSFRNRSPSRRGRHSRSPLLVGHQSRNRSPERGARPAGQRSSTSRNLSPLTRSRKGHSRSRDRSPRSSARHTKSRSPLSKNLSPPPQEENSEATSHAGRGISPAYRLASRLGDSRSPPKRRYPEAEARRSGERVQHPPLSRNWPSQNKRNPQNNMLPTSSPPSMQSSQQPRPTGGSLLQPPKMWPLNKGESSESQSPAEAEHGQRQPLRPLMAPLPLLPGLRKGISPAKKHSPEMEEEHQSEEFPSEAQPSADEAQDYSESTEDPDGPPQQHYGVRIEPFPTRSSNKDISFATFRVFKKFGYVTSIEIHGTEEGRFCLVFYRDEVGRNQALESGQSVDLLHQAVSVSAYDGPQTESNVVFRPFTTKASTKTPMQFSKTATKTLCIKNLDSSVARGDLHLTFQAFGKILDVSVKKKFNEPSGVAFIQYTDTVSVTRAIKAMNGTLLGENTVILSYAPTEPTNCVWIDGLKRASPTYLNKFFSRFGPVTLVAIDAVHKKALVFFYEVEHAQRAVNAVKGQRLAGCFVAVDYANYECQSDFYCTMHSTEQDVAELYALLMAGQ